MNTARIASEHDQVRTELDTLAEKDITELAAFIAEQSGGLRETVDAHLRWFLLENPARRPDDPLGFGLRAAGRLVGCILCCPQIFLVNGKPVLFMGSSSFYVDAAHRGHGGRIFLQYCRLATKSPLFGTSANAEAARLWKAAGANPIPGTDGELLGVLRWPPIVEEFAHRKNLNRGLCRLAGSSLAHIAGLARRLNVGRNEGNALRPITSPERASEVIRRDTSIKVTAERVQPYLRWRYFSGRDASAEAFAFGSENSGSEILVTVNQRIRGYRSQIKTLNVLDVYPEASEQDWLKIVGALIARYDKNVDAVVLRGLDAGKWKLFSERGFQPRKFDAPNGWYLDKSKLVPSDRWYFVPADGDGLI